MGKNDQFIYGESLRKHWEISDRLLESYINDGLPAYDNENLRIDPENIDRVDGYRFKLKEIKEFEIRNEHLFMHNENLQNSIMDAQASRKLAQLMLEKEKWDSAMDVAVNIGMFCHEQDRILSFPEIQDRVYSIDKSLPVSTIRNIWKAIPKKYKSKGGRPKKD